MELIADEVAFLQSLVPLAGAHLAELGCGKADFARALVARAGVAKVDAFEIDRIQHGEKLASAAHPKLACRLGGAEDIDPPDASIDGVVMMKTLHHVPHGAPRSSARRDSPRPQARRMALRVRAGVRRGIQRDREALPRRGRSAPACANG